MQFMSGQRKAFTKKREMPKDDIEKSDKELDII
jgi:hypothetical protein